MISKVIAFLVLNFSALAVGSLFTSSGVSSEWYVELNKAPWTPPGWVFGAAWTTIMICFSFYMASVWSKIEDKKQMLSLFAIQWVLNVTWNPIFFHFHYATLGLISISLLTLLVGFLMINYWPKLKWISLLIAPYFVWLIIATSLNGYVVFAN